MRLPRLQNRRNLILVMASILTAAASARVVIGSAEGNEAGRLRARLAARSKLTRSQAFAAIMGGETSASH
jgi:hypothetical protein